MSWDELSHSPLQPVRDRRQFIPKTDDNRLTRHEGCMLDVPRFFSYGILLYINLFFTNPRISVFVMIFFFPPPNDWNLNYAFHIHAELSDS